MDFYNRLISLAYPTATGLAVRGFRFHKTM